MSKKWTEEKIEKVKKLAKDHTAKETAKKMNTTYDSISSVASKYNIKFEGHLKNKWSKEEIEAIRDLAKTNTIRQIADKFGSTYDAIYKIIVKHNIDYQSTNENEWSDSEIIKLKKLSEKYTIAQIAEELDRTYSSVKNACLRYKIKAVPAVKAKQKEKENVINRDSFNIKKTNRNINKKYFVTSVVAGASLDKEAFETIQYFCKENNAELVIMPMRGVYKQDEGYADEVLELSDHFVTEFVFNKNLRAKDFVLSPQQINPLTGLTRYGQKDFSLIIASPKVQMETIPVSNTKMPHILHSTGVVTKPNYSYNRIGKIAHQDHVIGGLFVEVKNSEVFHLRQITVDKNKGFYDLGIYYKGNNKENKTASAFIAGDIHAGFEEESAINCWFNCINQTNPEYIFLHDVLDARSISHHEDNNLKAQLDRPKHLDTLEKELNNLVNTLENWIKNTKSKIMIVSSNHNEFLDRYLAEGRYVNDRFNHRLALELAIDYLDGKNPLEQYCIKNSKLINSDRVTWLKRDQDFKIAGIQLGSHGDLGSNGARGSILSMEKAFGKSVTGHSHSPRIIRETRQVGTSAINLGYNRGASGWLLQSGLVYDNGTYQSITSIDGEFKL